MFRVICFCNKHKGMNIYYQTSLKNAEGISQGWPGYRPIIYDAS